MKAYKGFNRSEDGTLWCRGFVYEPGKTYRHEGKIKLCYSGFHACHELHQVWVFYPNNGTNEFWEVECGGEIFESKDNDGKFVCSEIKLLKKVDVSAVAKFNAIYGFSEGFAMVKLNEKYNFINTEGKLLSEKRYVYAWNFCEGFAAVELNEKWNFIDTEGNFLSEQWFDDVWSFSEGFAIVRLNGKYNHIDTKGKLLSEQWYDDAWSSSEGFVWVKLYDKWHKIDSEWKIVE